MVVEQVKKKLDLDCDQHDEDIRRLFEELADELADYAEAQEKMGHTLAGLHQAEEESKLNYSSFLDSIMLADSERHRLEVAEKQVVVLRDKIRTLEYELNRKEYDQLALTKELEDFSMLIEPLLKGEAWDAENVSNTFAADFQEGLEELTELIKDAVSKIEDELLS